MTPLLEARGLSRSFGHVRALDNASFDVNAGEVVALIGDNGAGKSTMVKALTGNLDLDSGDLFFEGKPLHISTPQQASDLGMEVVYQDLALAPHLNPYQNMFLGREIPRKGLLGKLGFMAAGGGGRGPVGTTSRLASGNRRPGAQLAAALRILPQPPPRWLGTCA